MNPKAVELTLQPDEAEAIWKWVNHSRFWRVMDAG